MHRSVSICAIAGALAFGFALFGAVQAAPVTGLSAIAMHQAHAASLVDQAGWRRWRYHRNWWWRWRR